MFILLLFLLRQGSGRCQSACRSFGFRINRRIFVLLTDGIGEIYDAAQRWPRCPTSRPGIVLILGETLTKRTKILIMVGTTGGPCQRAGWPSVLGEGWPGLGNARCAALRRPAEKAPTPARGRGSCLCAVVAVVRPRRYGASHVNTSCSALYLHWLTSKGSYESSLSKHKDHTKKNVLIWKHKDVFFMILIFF